tara:strand:+ start:117 stop:374 length:258 start_codon:yes stop_codon:yes gene_type:complete
LTQNKNKEVRVQEPPISQTHFALASLFTVSSLLIFLALGDYEAVQMSAIAMIGLRATSWYFYDKPIDLFFTIIYLVLVASWQLLI